MPPPTTSWICDACGLPIEQATHGWVEWIELHSGAGAPPRGHKLRVVHKQGQGPSGRCQYQRSDGSIGDAALPEFQGPDGLIRLLEYVAEQRFPIPEVLEVIKRIHIPGYEQARRHFQRALAEGVIELNVAPGYWDQDELQRVLDLVAEDDC